MKIDKWEYKQAIKPAGMQYSPLEDWLNAYGQGGWECYHIGSNDTIFYFKRRL